jgi:predicted transcriptional regulator
MPTDTTSNAPLDLAVARCDDAIASAMRRRREAAIVLALQHNAEWGAAMIARGEKAANEGDIAGLETIAAECRAEPRLPGFGKTCEGRR